MATARLSGRRHGGAAGKRTALLLVLACGVLLLVMLNGNAHLSRSHRVVEDSATAAQLFQLAQSSASAAEFTVKLQAAGLMDRPSSRGSGSSSGSSGGGDSKAGDGGSGKGGGGGSATKKTYKVPQLSRELAHSHARDGIIIVTWANYHFFDFVLNWVHHMQVHGISNYLALAERGLNVFAMYDEAAGQADTGLGKEDFGWGSPTFHKMGRQKVDLARTFTDFDLDLCLCDVDTVWINDPTEYFERYPTAAILASSDDLRPTNPPKDDGLEQLDAIHSAMNIGLLFFRHGKNTTLFIDAWQRRLDADDKAWDQNVFNHVARDGLMPFQSPPDQPRLAWATNHSLLVGVLPVAQFASGHTFFVQRLFELQQVKPYVVHTTFQYGGSSGKRHRLREAMLWVDPPAYYSEGKFLSVDMLYPESPPGFQEQDKTMMEGVRFKTDWATDAMIDFHLKAMRAQLQQLRSALALAVALNRTLVMPKLVSWCDRYWGPVEFCQLPGAFKMRLPFVAPMDHVLEPFNFEDNPDQTPPIRFREYSFLANERTPKSLKESRVVVTPDAGVTSAVMKGEGAEKAVHIPELQTDEKLRELLEPYQDAQLLHFSSLERAFGKFADVDLGRRFQGRLNHMAGFFCCKQVKQGEDGGQSYQPYLDVPARLRQS